MKKMIAMIMILVLFFFSLFLIPKYASAGDHRYYHKYRSHTYNHYHSYQYRKLERDLVVLGVAALTLGVINAVTQTSYPYYHQPVPAMCIYESIRVDKRWMKLPNGEWELQEYTIPTKYTAPCR